MSCAGVAEFRKCVPGIDTSCGGYGNLRGLPTFNVDAQALQDIAFWKDGKAAPPSASRSPTC